MFIECKFIYKIAVMLSQCQAVIQKKIFIENERDEVKKKRRKNKYFVVKRKYLETPIDQFNCVHSTWIDM